VISTGYLLVKGTPSDGQTLWSLESCPGSRDGILSFNLWATLKVTSVDITSQGSSLIGFLHGNLSLVVDWYKGTLTWIHLICGWWYKGVASVRFYMWALQHYLLLGFPSLSSIFQDGIFTQTLGEIQTPSCFLGWSSVDYIMEEVKKPSGLCRAELIQPNTWSKIHTAEKLSHYNIMPIRLIYLSSTSERGKVQKFNRKSQAHKKGISKEKNVVCPSITSNSSLSFDARELKFCIQRLHISTKKDINQIFEILSEGWDMRDFLLDLAGPALIFSL